MLTFYIWTIIGGLGITFILGFFLGAYWEFNNKEDD